MQCQRRKVDPFQSVCKIAVSGALSFNVCTYLNSFTLVIENNTLQCKVNAEEINLNNYFTRKFLRRIFLYKLIINAYWHHLNDHLVFEKDHGVEEEGDEDRDDADEGPLLQWGHCWWEIERFWNQFLISRMNQFSFCIYIII